MNRRLELALDCQQPDCVPFLPGIFAHKAWFVDETPSKVCTDVNLFTTAILAEFERIQPDALTIGIDIENVEAEAVGSKLIYFEGRNTSLPAIAPDGVAFQGTEDVTSLRMPDPKKDGRMPLTLEVARRVVRVLGKEVPIRGAISGPFSMAAHLVGPEHLFMLAVTHPRLVKDLLAFSTEVIKRYGRAFIELGCQVIIVDRYASPDSLSPQMYHDLVLAPTRNAIRYFQEAGLRHVSLMISGDTTKILESYLATGANSILCDSQAHAKEFLQRCSPVRRAFQRNLDSSDFLQAAPDDLRSTASACLEESDGYPGFVLGTAAVPYGTPLENILAIRDAVRQYKGN